MSALDVQLFHALNHALSSGAWFWIFVALSLVGGGWGALVIVPLWARPGLRPHLRPLVHVLLAQALLVFTLKRMVARERPHFADIRRIFLPAPTDFSFPSGHASGSFAFCVFLAIVLVRTARTDEEARRSRAIAAGLLLFAFGVGLSRIALGVHFPGDVLGGALLGSAIATVGAQLHLARFPTPTP